MTALVYVHGTNGSGKSTLARAVATAAGGIVDVRELPTNRKARWTLTRKVVLIGKYGNACGGVDGLSPYAAIHDIMPRLRGAHVFAEGLITPGVETCQKLADYKDEHLFIALCTPIQDCIRHVLQRRKAKGNTKPYDPANLLRKAESVLSWHRRLNAAGLKCELMTFEEAYLSTLELLGLQPPSVDVLLGK